MIPQHSIKSIPEGWLFYGYNEPERETLFKIVGGDCVCILPGQNEAFWKKGHKETFGRENSPDIILNVVSPRDWTNAILTGDY